jgi:hypothetical protein
LKEAGECALYGGDRQRALAYLDKAGAAEPGDEEIAHLRAKALDSGSAGDAQ